MATASVALLGSIQSKRMIPAWGVQTPWSRRDLARAPMVGEERRTVSHPGQPVPIVERRGCGSERESLAQGHTASWCWGWSLNLASLHLKLSRLRLRPVSSWLSLAWAALPGVAGTDLGVGGSTSLSQILSSPNERFSDLGPCCVTLGKSLPSLDFSFLGYEVEERLQSK